MSRDESSRTLRVSSRRSVLKTIGVSVAALPLAHFFGCADEEGGGNVAADGGGGSSNTADGGGGSSNITDGGAWATGGTASMSGSYADPFAGGLGAACALTCAATLGPCYAETIERKDISEGHDGLPTRLAFLIVDEACNPIEGASVDVWHCAPEGLYSGEDASDFCTSGDATARAARWFRGVQTTGADGRVDFDTCFPGWYSGRTVHIHFTVRRGDTEYVTSQFVFDDTLVDGIVGGEPLYDARGPRDTTNTNDGVIAAESAAAYSFQTARMPDGAMMAWKAIVLRSSTAAALCHVPGGSRGMGGGAPPSR